MASRLDLDVDGPANTVYASQSEAAEVGDGDPYGLGLVVRDTPLRTELEGRQDYDWAVHRGWKVVNDNVRNGLGTPVGYALVPAGSFPPLIDRASPAFRRAGVIEHTPVGDAVPGPRVDPPAGRWGRLRSWGGGQEVPEWTHE